MSNSESPKPTDTVESTPGRRSAAVKLAFLDAFEAAMIEASRRLREPLPPAPVSSGEGHE